MKLGTFAVSNANDLGIGKIAEVDLNAGTITLEYFDSPVSGSQPTRSVPFKSVERKQIERQVRVYFLDHATGSWRMGRAEGL